MQHLLAQGSVNLAGKPHHAVALHGMACQAILFKKDVLGHGRMEDVELKGVGGGLYLNYCRYGSRPRALYVGVQIVSAWTSAGAKGRGGQALSTPGAADPKLHSHR